MSDHLPVGQAAPQLTPVLNALIKHARTLMDASFSAAEIFESHFDGKLQIDNFVPTSDADLTIASAVRLFPEQKNHITVALITSPDSASKPQYWRIDLAGAPIAQKTLADRSEWAKLPEAGRADPKDKGWEFSSGLAQHQLDPAFCNILSNISVMLKNGEEALLQLAEQCRDPDFVSRMNQHRQAKYGLAFARDKSVAPINVLEIAGAPDISGLMSRFKLGARP